MMELKFKFKPKDERSLYVTERYYTNGHWLVDRQLIRINPVIAKAFKPIEQWKDGRYEYGVLDPTAKAPDCARIIPDIGEGYYDKAKLSGDVLMDMKVASAHCVLAFVWETIPETSGRVVKEAGIAPEYMGLTCLGEVRIRDGQHPVAILAPDEQVIAVIMPVRLGRK